MFLTKYDHVEQILLEKGFSIYREPNIGQAQKENLTQELEDLIHRYNRFLVDRLGLDKAKAYRTIEHDMAVWQSVKGQRRAGTSALDIGALFLTADHNLFAFDWQRLRQRNVPGHVILPNQLLQLLRPFLVVSTEFDKKFAATFAVPEFRTAATDYGSTISKVLGYLATFADVSEETASRILANEVLLGRLRELSEDSVEFKAVVDSALLKDNQLLLAENERLLTQVSSSKTAQKDAVDTLETREHLIARQNELLRERDAVVSRQAEELAAASQALKAEQEARTTEKEQQTSLQDELSAVRDTLREEQHRREFAEAKAGRAQVRLRGFLALLFLLVGGLALAAASLYLPWFEHHPKRIGVILCATFIIAGGGWAIWERDATRRWMAIGAVVIASMISLTQIIDREPDKLQAPGSTPIPTVSPTPP